MDLVEVNPMAKPPVCKIMDYGKFKYDEKKKANEAKKKQVVVQLKEVKLRPQDGGARLRVQGPNVREFLEEGNKARITIMFRGREITHRELGQRVLKTVIEDLRTSAVVEQMPRMEGRQMFMILAPNPKVAAARSATGPAAGGRGEGARPRPQPARRRPGTRRGSPPTPAPGAAAPPAAAAGRGVAAPRPARSRTGRGSR